MADIFLRQNYFRLLRVTHLSERNISMCILLRCADRFNFVMRNRVWTTHHLCKNCSDFKLLLEVGNSEYDIRIDDKMFAGWPKIELGFRISMAPIAAANHPAAAFYHFLPSSASTSWSSSLLSSSPLRIQNHFFGA